MKSLKNSSTITTTSSVIDFYTPDYKKSTAPERIFRGVLRVKKDASGKTVALGGSFYLELDDRDCDVKTWNKERCEKYGTMLSLFYNPVWSSEEATEYEKRLRIESFVDKRVEILGRYRQSGYDRSLWIGHITLIGS